MSTAGGKLCQSDLEGKCIIYLDNFGGSQALCQLIVVSTMTDCDIEFTNALDIDDGTST